MPSVKAEEMGTHCLICMCNPSNIVLIPCNHLCICSECFKKLKEHGNQLQEVKCPICRLDVDTKHQILIIYDEAKQLENQKTMASLGRMESLKGAVTMMSEELEKEEEK
jgi:hypothetical protein